MHEEVPPAGVLHEADAVHGHALLRPQHTAIHFKDRRLSYSELDRRADQVASGIVKLGVNPCGRVALLTKNSDEFFEILFGLIRSNRVAVPVSWRLAAPEIAFILNDAGVDTIFIHATLRGLIGDPRHPVPKLRNIIILGDQQAVDSYAVWRDQQSDQPISLTPRIEAEDVMIQFYTSGTTGLPKGVQITHHASRQMRLLELGNSVEFASWGPEDVAIVALPNSHLSGTSWALQWFARGATCVIHEQIDAGAFLTAVEEFKVTQLVAVPTVLGLMIDHPLRPTVDHSSLKNIYYGSAPISPQLLERCLMIFKCRLVQIYGMTETNGVLCYLDASDHDLRRPHLLKSCGKPYPMVDLKIMNGEGMELPARAIGEICVDSPCLMKGYWNRHEGFEGLMHGRYFRTGDGGYVDEEGFVYLVDRLKDMIVSGGENVYPAEIEIIARELTGVQDIAVIGLPDAHWGEVVMAVIAKGDSSLTEQEFLAFIRGRIAGYKVPKSVVFLDALPYNASGKVLKRQLRDQFGKRSI